MLNFKLSTPNSCINILLFNSGLKTSKLVRIKKSIQFLNKNEILTNWKALYTAFLGKCDMNKKDYLKAMPKLKYAIDHGKIDIESNGTHLIVGEITKIQLPEFILNKDGFVDLEAIETIASSGVDAYYSVKLLARYQYAKANQKHWP